MKKATRFVGLEVHKETIAVAAAETGGEVRSLGTIPNSADAVQKLIKKLGTADTLRVCYEAGPCGCVLYWHLTRLGVRCDVIAPTLVPVKAGDRVKTDRCDAENLARCYRVGASRRSRCPMRSTKRCAIPCVRAKPPKRISGEARGRF